MEARRQCREWIVQLLFMLDMNRQELPQLFHDFWSEREASSDGREFVERHVLEIVNNIKSIDETIKSYSHNWDLHRIGAVERNVIRMSIYEILYRADIPAVVSINEAVDIAKYFGNSQSGRFVNGILDNFRKSVRGADDKGIKKKDGKKKH